MAETGVRIEGLQELQRAFRLARTGISRDLRAGLESAAEPVRQDAERLTFSEISGMRRGVIPWHSMRVGVTQKMVYVAPMQRGDTSLRSTRKRRNLPPLIIRKAYEPALAANRDDVVREAEDVLRDIARMWSRV